MLKSPFNIFNANIKRAGTIVFCLTLIVGLGMIVAACSGGNAQTLPAAESKSYALAAAGDIIQLGGIDWRVLEIKDGKALILSEKVVFNRKYHSSEKAITWEECDLRQYLNRDFYDVTFSAEEKQLIAETTVANKENPWYATPGGNDTTDKLFLLSIEEALQYFGDSGSIESWQGGGISFISDQFNEGRITKTLDGESAWWWLRSSGLFYSTCENVHSCAASVNEDGSLSVQGNFITASRGGVRPALWLNL